MVKTPANPPADGSRELLRAFASRLLLVLNTRRLLGMGVTTQAEVHRELERLGVHVSDGTISRWFKGQFWPSEPHTMLGLARAVGCDPGWLYFAPETECEPPHWLAPIIGKVA